MSFLGDPSMRARLLIGFAVVVATGCGGGTKFAAVSGRVTLNGQPLANATVSFQPIPGKGVIDPGPGSLGKTNDNGDFSLILPTGQLGAVVGRHRVLRVIFASADFAAMRTSLFRSSNNRDLSAGTAALAAGPMYSNATMAARRSSAMGDLRRSISAGTASSASGPICRNASMASRR